VATRMVGWCILSPTALVLRGSVSDVEFGCPPIIPYLAYEYSKTVIELTGPEQAEVAACWDMLRVLVDAEESCADRRTVREYHMSLIVASGVVNQLRAYVDGPSIGPRALGLWGWGKGRTAFASGERDQLDDLVALAISYMEAEEPV
jgi:hypothetical protein